MKKSITLKQLGFTLISLFITTQLFAQPGNKPGNSSSQDRHEKIEQLKITFITRELNLTSSEAQQFWPVYNEMSDQLKIEKKKQRVIIKSLKTNFVLLKRSTVTVLKLISFLSALGSLKALLNL